MKTHSTTILSVRRGNAVVVAGDLVTTPDTIPQIVNYGDGGSWTDLGRTLDAIAAMDFDFLVGGTARCSPSSSSWI